MSHPIGITVPKMLRESSAKSGKSCTCTRISTNLRLTAITGTWSLPFAAYFLALSMRVAAQRGKNEKYIGETTGKGDSDDELLIASRCHANFAENVPIALFLASVVELNGGNRKVLSGSLAALLLLRILHVELGLMGPGAMSGGRPIGYYVS